MPYADNNGVKIYYESHGNPQHPTLLLTNGLGRQILEWTYDMVPALVDQGFHTVCYDNRDVGLSDKIESQESLNLAETLMKVMMKQEVNVPYELSDMAKDGMAVMEEVGKKQFHVAGYSMGGMISQTAAHLFPNKVLSLTSIMSTTGNPELPQPKGEVGAMLMSRPDKPHDKESVIEHSVKVRKLIESPAYPTSDEMHRQYSIDAYERCHYPEGVARQMIAIVSAGDRRAQVSTISALTLVIHGADDPLVPVEGGKDTAQNIANSRLEIIDGMGHEMPTALAARISSLIVDHVHDAQRQSTAEPA